MLMRVCLCVNACECVFISRTFILAWIIWRDEPRRHPPAPAPDCHHRRPSHLTGLKGFRQRTFLEFVPLCDLAVLFQLSKPQASTSHVSCYQGCPSQMITACIFFACGSTQQFRRCSFTDLSVITILTNWARSF